MLIGQIAGELAVIADLFATRAVERHQPLGDAPAFHAVQDAQRLHPPLAQPKERAVVVSRGQGLIHPLQPRARIIRGPRGFRSAERERADHGTGEEPAGENGHGGSHCADRASCGTGWRSVASCMTAPPPAPALAPGPGSSGAASSSDRTLLWPSAEEYRLCAKM